MQLPPQIQQAHALVSAGRAGEAVKLLSQLASKGDGPASYQLAEWYREGQLVRRDFGIARNLYGRSAQAGIVEGLRRLIALVAVGVGGARDWPTSLELLSDLARVDTRAERERSLVQAMDLTGDGDPRSAPAGETLSESPGLVRFPDILSEAECRYLIDAAEPLFEPALTVEEYTGKQIRNPVRTSDTAAFPWVGENPAIHAINRRIAAASGTVTEQGEPIQVLRYRLGQEYKPHIDAIPGLASQRIMTMLIYLNEDFDGGTTEFLTLGLTVQPRIGEGLLFYNVDAEGRPDKRLLHAGLPVTAGVKFLASRWIRARTADV